MENLQGGSASSGQMLALNANWLDNGTVSATNSCGYGVGQITFTPTVTYYPSYCYPVYYQSPARPIKLTLSEVERLRKLARADEKVKVILAKFTDLIEITVDFE